MSIINHVRNIIKFSRDALCRTRVKTSFSHIDMMMLLRLLPEKLNYTVKKLQASGELLSWK